MRRTALILAGLFALGAHAQEGDAGFGLSQPDPTVAPTPTPAPEAQPEPQPEPEPQPQPEPQPEPPPAEAIPNPDPAPAESFVHRVEANGYASLRGTFTRSRTRGLLPTDDQPQASALVELNGQLKVSFLERSFAYADVSAIFQAATAFRGTDKDGNEVVVDDHDVAAYRPAVSLNELYVLHELHPELNVMLGKKRVVWGSGQAFNPTDLLNLRKDPTDPTFQRAGSWVARIEVPLESLTFTAVFAPSVLKQASGLPQQFLVYPSWDRQDEQAHYLAALRAYALVADADVNLMFFYSNRYNDAFEKKFRFGGSFSRYFFTDYELHTEFLIQSGSTRDYVDHDCVLGAVEAFVCAQARTPFISKARLDDATLLPKLLVGTRRQFDDESFLSIEYLYQADGYSPAQYQDLVNAFDLVVQAKAAGVPSALIPNLNPGASSSDGVPQRFNFDPTARHYLFITYGKPRIRDDFTAQLVMLANLQDLSTLWTPSISWSTTEWLTLTAIAFLPVPGPDALASKRSSTEERVTEYGSLPMRARFLLEARIFY